jgi:chlorite dismutase
LDINSENWQNRHRKNSFSQPRFLTDKMALFDFDKKEPEISALRLVSDNKEPQSIPVLEKQFVNFIFFRVNPDWRKLNSETKRVFKGEFQSVFNKFNETLLLFSYSLVGFDSKADLMFWRIGSSLDSIQEMTAKLYRTNLGSYLETTDNYLAVTKKMMFIPGDSHDSVEDRYHVKGGQKKYHFVYPCAKSRDWYSMTDEERTELIEQNFMVGKKFENIKIHMTHAFGFSEQEYIVSFETDEPKDFLALAEEMRETAASKFTMRGMPIYTCRQRSLMECLDAIG